MKARDQKESQRDTQATLANQISGIDSNVEIDGDFKKYPEIHDKSIETMQRKGFKYLFPI